MEKIDLKDRKILFELDLNSRQTLTQIGKKVGLPKTVVAYRIKRLQDKKIIRNFYTVVDVYKLGLIMMRFHYRYQYTTPEQEKMIINFFVNKSNTTLVASTQGMFNLKVVKIIKDINDFYNIWQESQKNFGYYFQEKSSSLFIDELYYAPTYLLLNRDDLEKREKISLIGRGKKVEIDELDYEILKLISINARMPITKIAEILKYSTRTINNKLKKLIKNGVIKGFRTDIDISKLGFHIFRVNIFLRDYNERNQIINHIKDNPNLAFVDTYTGDADLEIEFHLESINRLYQIMQNITTRFPNAIRDYKHLNVTKYYKFLYLPEDYKIEEK
jgi:Lrp/AsnC family leucine-responsive transcriptional regulator